MKEWVKEKIEAERHLTNTALDELKTNLTMEVTGPCTKFSFVQLTYWYMYTYIYMTVQILRMHTDMMAELERRLTEVWNLTQSTYVTETVMMQTLEVQIKQHLETAKQQWMKLVGSVYWFTVNAYTCTTLFVVHPLADTVLHMYIHMYIPQCDLI